MSGVEFKRTVTLDTVVATLLLLGAIVGCYVSLDERLTRVEIRIEDGRNRAPEVRQCP
jgi:hypothetical protein